MQWTHALLAALLVSIFATAWPADVVDTTTIRGKVYCGYQGWFRCPGDGADLKWIHWSRGQQPPSATTMTVDMWPDMSEYGPDERYPVPGFTYPDGAPATLFSSCNSRTVLRHFEWMRDYGIDGIFLQRFVVGLRGAPLPWYYPSVLKVMNNVRRAAKETGRVWAISYDIAAMPGEDLYEVLTADWKHLVDRKLTEDPRYLHEGGKPVVQIWGFYKGIASHQLDLELARRLIRFFKQPGPYQACFVAGGDWNWREWPAEWRDLVAQCDVYSPWNIGNWRRDEAGHAHASTSWWKDDLTACQGAGVLWFPTVYPGFTWDNLTQKPPGTSKIDREGGHFLWEQFYELARLGVDTVYVAMFDEVDEGTAVFKVTSSPPTQAYFVGYDGLPSDWYLRLVGEGQKMLRGERPPTPDLPFAP